VNCSEQREGIKLVKRLVLVSMPFILLVFASIIIDPFQLTRYVSLPLDKQTIACVYNERLWKLNQCAQQASEYLLIGDSRAQRITQEQLTACSHKPWHCIALSGATLIELVDTFWFAARHTPLKEVLFCINFDRYNDWQTASGVHHAQELIEQPLLAACAPEVWKATLFTLAQLVYRRTIAHQQPPVSKELFWQEQLREGALRYQRYVAPVYAYKELERMSMYCKEHEIKLTFVTLPTHVEFQQLITNAGLENEQQAFKQTLAKLANVCDLDVTSDFTTNADYFSDPWHANWDPAEKLTKIIFENDNTRAL
jgi:hypothetical protein